MKKLLFTFCLCLFTVLCSKAQTNTFPTSGNVGIGTINPSSIVHIKGSKDNVLTFQTSDNAWLYTNWLDNTNTRRLWMGLGVDLSSFNIIVENGTNKILLNGGNVGIGTSNPDSKLTVKGTIHTNEVKVDLLGAVAPDYVFNKGYDLKPLKTVEKYIAINGHLPNIPSAKDMETDGILLKEMNLKLLEKIEELTLYAIEQERETVTLKIELQNQENEIKILKEKAAKVDNLEEKLLKIEALLNSKKQ